MILGSGTPADAGVSRERNNKTFKIGMATVSHWTKVGTMDEEYLFWDNETYKKQLGLTK